MHSEFQQFNQKRLCFISKNDQVMTLSSPIGVINTSIVRIQPYGEKERFQMQKIFNAKEIHSRRKQLNYTQQLFEFTNPVLKTEAPPA